MMKDMHNRSRKERGQALVIVAFSIITLIAFVGLGVDLGLTYVEKVRVQRAADAAALAAAAELPLEPAARVRALEYLSENNYDCGLVVVGGGVQCTRPDVHVNVDGAENFEDDPESSAKTHIVITTMNPTLDNHNNPIPNTSSRIRVKVTQQVPLYFMKLLGFTSVPVSGVASAENIINLDVVVVFDKSGSMEFDTLCYGCWVPINNQPYPIGNLRPLPWSPTPNPSGVSTALHCSGNGAPAVTGGKSYYLIEAEEYSYISNDYHRASHGAGYTYWVMQRNGKITDPFTDYLGNNAGADGRDTQGAYISHMPFQPGYNQIGGATGVPCVWEDVNNGFMCRRGDWITDRSGPFPAPRVDYEFTIPASPTGGNTWYLWVRAQGGATSSSYNDPNKGQGLFWGLDEGQVGGATTLRGRGAQNKAPGDNDDYKYGVAFKNDWTWRRLQLGATGGGGNSMTLTPGRTYTLHLWAGSPGFSVDRILITNSSSDTIYNSAGTVDNNRTKWACDPCDARFGGSPDSPAGPKDPPICNDPTIPEPSRYRYNDDLFDDEQPLASTAASAQRFLSKLDYQFDQVGLVKYSNKADSAIELLCLKSHGAGCIKNVIDNTIVMELMSRQKTFAGGGTNIPDGLEEALKMLDDDPPHYGRPNAAHIIILMTDGQPNVYDSLDVANRDCHAGDLYPGGDNAQECSVYMAARARDKGIIIYGITLGEGADQPLMDAIAQMTGGEHLHAENPEALDAIFDYLYNRIFLRLVE